MMIDRPRYIEWMQRWKDKPVIKVITGLRRCGKSSLLELFQKKLVNEGIEESHIISINFESMDEEYPRQADALYDFIKALLRDGKNYVFLDEIQHVKDFERTADALAIREDVDLYITGSNAFFLSGELATLLTGRYVELRMLPLSFSELWNYSKNENKETLFQRYMDYGGLPFLTRLDDEESIADYLGGVFNTIIVKDISIRHPRINMHAFERVASFLADNIGNTTSLSKISKRLGEDGKGIAVSTVGEYASAMLKNYLLFKTTRFDIRGKDHLDTLEKYYLGDLGFRFWLLGRTRQDIGRCLENIVYLELLRRYRRVFVGKLGEREVDFVAVNESGTHYYQVAQTVLDTSTMERELSPLRKIQNDYPKTLLTLDRIGLSDHEGIAQRNVIDWLIASDAN